MPTILLADDHSFCCELFSLAVERAGYKVFTARNGFDALKLLRATSIDLLLLDLHMPQLDGLSTLRIIRSSEFKRLPVLLLTAVEDKEQITAAAQLGIQGYILKSQFVLQDFMIRLEKLLSREGKEPIGAVRTQVPLPANVGEVWGEVA